MKETEAGRLIRYSAIMRCLPRVSKTPDLAFDLAVESEGYVEPKDGDWEYWGTYNGNPWRIHLV